MMNSLLLLVVSIGACQASIGSVYVAQSSAGANNGTSCANAFAGSFFNTSGNWGVGASQIGAGTQVNVCGIWTGSNGVNFLQFQGSGSSGNVISLVFQTGAAMQPTYCAAGGCIDLNGYSYILIDGGTTCGETSHWTSTACNGTIQNYGAGSTGATCPNGSPCVSLSGSGASSVAIGSSGGGGNSSNIEIRNLYIHMYTRLATDTSDSGMATYGIAWGGGTLSQGINVHNVVINGVGKAFSISLGSTSGTVTGYQMYNSNVSSQCWVMGLGANSTTMNVTGLTFHDNEVSDWDEWAPANTTGNVCHANGTMWFNTGTPSGGFGFIGDSASGMWNNYIHGNLAGNAPGTSPSGYISCQDNCININVFNNIIIDTSTGTDGGGAIYFNGPGGGGQKVFNNTVVRPCCSMVVTSGVTANVTVQNNILKCTNTNCTAIEIRPNTPAVVTSDFNDGYQNSISSGWTVYNTASSGTFLSLASWRGTYTQDTNSITTDPNLTVTYTLNAGSPAIGTGTNLTSLGITGLNVDVSGNPRPSSGAWTIGAYNYVPSSVVFQMILAEAK